MLPAGTLTDVETGQAVSGSIAMPALPAAFFNVARREIIRNPRSNFGSDVGSKFRRTAVGSLHTVDKEIRPL